MKTMAQLTYPVKFLKLEILPEELHALIKEKVQSILTEQACQSPEQMTESIKEVSRMLGRKTKKGGDGLDLRFTIANANFQEAGAASSQSATTSPRRTALANPEFVPNQAKDVHDYQETLFTLLIEDEKLPGVYKVEGGYLKINGNNLTYIEMCNILDEATKMFMVEGKSSITQCVNTGQSLRKIYDSCNAVVTARLSLHATFEDNILDVDNAAGYKKWKKHICIIASFAALMVSLHNLLH